MRMHGSVHRIVKGFAMCHYGCIFKDWPNESSFARHTDMCTRAARGPLLWRTGTSESATSALRRTGIVVVGRIRNHPVAVQIIYDKSGLPTHLCTESMLGIYAVCIAVTVRIVIKPHDYVTDHVMYTTLWPYMDSQSGSKATLLPPLCVSTSVPVDVNVTDVRMISNSVARGNLPKGEFLGLGRRVWEEAQTNTCVSSRMLHRMCGIPQEDILVLGGTQKKKRRIQLDKAAVSIPEREPPVCLPHNDGGVCCPLCKTRYPSQAKFASACGISDTGS